MARFRFIHAADLHLDTPFEGVSSKNERLAERLRDASLATFDALVKFAIERDVAFVVFSGDLYDGPNRGLRAQLRFLKGLERLSEHKIASFIVHGNHDPLEGWSAISKWPEHVTVFGSNQVERVEVSREGQPLAQVYGISYARREMTENLSERFEWEPGPGVHVGVLHCNVGSHSEHAPYSPCTIKDLQSRNLDYWALGHIHKRQILSAGKPWIVYPGNFQGLSFKPSEQGEKGVMLVECDGDRVLSADFVAVDQLRFLSSDIDISDMAEVGDLDRVILRHIDRLRAEHAGRDLVVRLNLVGRSGLARDLKRDGVMNDQLRVLREECESLTPMFFIDELSHRVRTPIDYDLLRSRGDLISEIVKTSDRVASDSMQLGAFGDRYLEILRRGETGRALLQVNSGSLEELLREAERMAIELLDPEVER